MHYCNKQKKYISVRGNKGGVRKVALPETATMRDVLVKAQNIFFRKGKSIKGKAENMVFNLGLYNGEKINDDSQTIIEYFNEHFLTKLKLYVLSKPKMFIDFVNNLPSDQSDSEDDFETNLPYLASAKKTSSEQAMDQSSTTGLIGISNTTRNQPFTAGFSRTSTNVTINQPLTTGLIGISNSTRNQPSTTGLIGTSEERNQLRASIDRAFHESLAIDAARTNSLNVFESKDEENETA